MSFYITSIYGFIMHLCGLSRIGDEGDNFYVIDCGEVEVCLYHKQDREDYHILSLDLCW